MLYCKRHHYRPIIRPPDDAARSRGKTGSGAKGKAIGGALLLFVSIAAIACSAGVTVHQPNPIQCIIGVSGDVNLLSGQPTAVARILPVVARAKDGCFSGVVWVVHGDVVDSISFRKELGARCVGLEMMNGRGIGSKIVRPVLSRRRINSRGVFLSVTYVD